MVNFIDLRSDTVTQPTQMMREAMYNAVVGDDIMGEDPTVIELENLVASILGKEKGLFVSSGTMANQLAVMTLTNRGEEVLVGNNSHIFNLEVAGLAVLSQVQTRSFDVVNGVYDSEVIENLIQEKGIQRAKTGLICIENTNDLNVGLVVPKENIDEICLLSHNNDIPIYMDGARLFNAEIKSGIEAKKIVENVDAVMIALTKGIGAPFGAVLVGNEDFINKARWFKQRIGGGYRQAGFMAAPAIVGIHNMRNQIEIDHENAQLLGKALEKIKKLTIDVTKIHTNIISASLDKSDFSIDEFLLELLRKGIKAKRISKNGFRMVTHYGIDREHVEYTANSVAEILD